MDEQERRRLMGFRKPRTKRENADIDNLDLGGAGTTIAKYGIPLAVLLSENKRTGDLRDAAKVDLEEPELMTGRVRSLRRPNFGLRRRDPSGSSLAEYVAGQKYGDAFQRDQEIGFEIADEQSRIGQENQIVDRTNQASIAKNQTRNQEKMMSGNLAMHELLGNNLPFKQEALLGLYHNIQSDSAQNSYVNSLERSQSAAAILTDPMSSEEDRKAARDYFMSNVKKAKGGKIKKYAKPSKW